MNEIKLYPIDKLEPHPGNPRKDLGDLTELADSIKAMGVLQNLIAVEQGNKLRVIAGHRRLAAAKKAGLKEVPVAIRELTERQQQEMMLTENLQRSDLTLLEQAEGIQMLMDLGATVEDVCKETGFSERTVYHRINIAKLNPKAIKKAEKERGEQLSLKDFILLEQIKDIKKRESVLKEAGGARDFKWHVDRIVENEKTEANTKDLEAKAIKAGMEKGEWKFSWEGVDNYDSNKYVLLKKLPKTKYYAVKDGYICFYDPTDTKKADAKEQKRKEQEKKRKAMLKTLKDLEEQMAVNILSYSRDLLDTTEGEEKEMARAEMLKYIAWDYSVYGSKEEGFNLLETVDDFIKYMLAEALDGTRWLDNWNGEVRKFGHEALDEYVKYLQIKGFKWSEEEANLLGGVHPAQMEIKKLR